jgi:hypothetical protein
MNNVLSTLRSTLTNAKFEENVTREGHTYQWALTLNNIFFGQKVPNLWHFICYGPHGSFTPGEDQWVSDKDRAQKALENMGRFFSGDIQGNKKLIITRPANSLGEGFQGRAGWVFSDYLPGTNCVELVLENGVKQSFDVKQEYLPKVKPSWLHLELDGHGGLIPVAKEPLYVPDNANLALTYWSMETLSKLLDGRSVGIGVGPQVLPVAIDILTILDGGNVKESFTTYQYTRREERRSRVAAKADAEQLDGVVAQPSSEYHVSADDGRVVSLEAWPFRTTVVANLAQSKYKIRYNIANQSDRLSVARQMNLRGQTLTTDCVEHAVNMAGIGILVS